MAIDFIKNKEDFTCANCGEFVRGTGYTNHCPKCLWSKHVDIDPGDRACDCGGLMEPVDIEKDGDGYNIVHKCTLCGQVKRNKASKDDDIESFWSRLVQ